MNSCLKFEYGGSVSVLYIQIHPSDYSVCAGASFPLGVRRRLLILIPCSFHAGPAFIKNVRVCVWCVEVHCGTCACRDCVSSCSFSLSDGFPLPNPTPPQESVSIFITFTPFFVCVCPKFLLPSTPVHFWTRFTFSYLLPSVFCVIQITCVLSGRLSADSSSWVNG